VNIRENSGIDEYTKSMDSIMELANQKCSQGIYQAFIVTAVARLLYYYDRSFTILENFHAEMAEKFSFDLRRIKKNTFFSDVTMT